MSNSKQSGVFQAGEEIEWEFASEGIQRKMYGYDSTLMMVKLRFEKGAIGVLHQHHHTQVSYVESGEFELTIAGEEKILKRGDGYFIPTNVVHGLLCIEPGTLVEAFAPYREDFLK